MSKICISLTARTLARNLDILEKYRKYVDVAELRVDCLDPNERLMIRRFPEIAGLPVILSIRRKADGGHFVSGEGSRINLMARGLAYADLDRRKNFAYIDLEEDFNVPSIEEAARSFGTRIIRSFHGIYGDEPDLTERLRPTFDHGDDIVKISLTAKSSWDVLGLLRLGKTYQNREKIIAAMGSYGICSRILARQFGSAMSITFPMKEDTEVFGHLDAKTLVELYGFRNIGPKTRIFGLAGFDIDHRHSSRFFNFLFKHENLDAVYVPFPTDSMAACLAIAGELGVEGFSVLAPYKGLVLDSLGSQSEDVTQIGASNVITRNGGSWLAGNTEGAAFSESLLAFVRRQHLRGVRVTLLGAGAAAKAIARELFRLRAKVLVLNRTEHKAHDLARQYRFVSGGLDSRGIGMMDRYRDIIVQATGVGEEGGGSRDPILHYRFSGQEVLMDLLYRPEVTPLMKRAMDAGCAVLGGRDMFMRQARYEYMQFMGGDFPDHLMSKIKIGDE
ncbi:MAG: type I 3-dehydroquinate dehydratase [Treponema sp.]|nr:type I 3-dehydroquinate dehydratase [Treponema sp.]